MNLYKYFPVASDRMGIIWTLTSIKDVCIIEFGPAGTTHYAVEGIGQLNGEDNAKLYSTHMNESDVAFGTYDRLEKSILEVDFNIKPKYIFVMASSVSAVIGTDIESVCRELEEKVNAKLIPVTTAGLKDDYNYGVESALSMIVENIVQEPTQKEESFNIIGSSMDAFNFKSDAEEIKRMVETFYGKNVNTIFTSNTSIEEIEESSKASLNIVIRKEGLKAAEYMKEKFNIPYVYRKPVGLAETLAFLDDIKEVTSWERCEEKLNEEVAVLKKLLFRMSFKVRGLENKKVAIFGDEDTVISMKKFMEELKLDVDRAQIIHATKESYDDIVVDSGEVERMKYLKDAELLMVLGDGVSLDMDHTSKKDIQVSNPNLDAVNIYPYTPYVGLRGCILLIEKIMGIK